MTKPTMGRRMVTMDRAGERGRESEALLKWTALRAWLVLYRGWHCHYLTRKSIQSDREEHRADLMGFD